jgi:myo-inositol-1(or 4)-monophosphatase
MSINTEKILAQTVSIVKDVADFQRKEFSVFSSNKIRHKGSFDLVSYVDESSETQLRNSLTELLPGSGFWGEEGGRSEGTQFEWIVDPLDGTTNFVCGIPFFAISVALYQENSPLLGVVYEVMAQKEYTALRGHGAFSNQSPIHVNTCKQLKDGLFATGFPVKPSPHLKEIGSMNERFIRETRGLRRFGSAALDLAWTASGIFSGFYEFGLSPWDVAAGALLVTEAGGSVSDFSNSNTWLHGGEILASNRILHPNLISLINNS